MARRSIRAVAAAAGLVAAVGALNLYQRYTTEEVPYTVVATLGDVELRRYPPAVLVETTAPTGEAAFRRLFAYIRGANEGDAEIAMTTPVEVTGEGTGIEMTAPVTVSAVREFPTPVPAAGAVGGTGEVVGGRTDAGTDREAGEEDEAVRMAFYLPARYDLASAPRPTDDAVDLVAAPERTLAVKRFSWRPTGERVAERAEELLARLEAAEVAVEGDPFFMGYDAPWTLPFLRRNEVAVEVADG